MTMSGCVTEASSQTLSTCNNHKDIKSNLMVMDVICPNDKATLHWVSGVPSPGGKERSSSSDPSVSLSLMWTPHMIDCVSMNFHVSVSSLARTAVIVTLLQKLPSLANHRSLNTKYGLFSLSSWTGQQLWAVHWPYRQRLGLLCLSPYFQMSLKRYYTYQADRNEIMELTVDVGVETDWSRREDWWRHGKLG